jgi:hypothetical protein
MPDSISWSFNAAGSSGGTCKDNGKVAVDAILTAHRTVAKAPAAAEGLKLQLDTPAKVAFLAITSSANDGTVKIKATGTEVAMKGPLILYGDAIGLFATDLTTLTVKNTGTEAAELSILVGLNLV